jgi:hypothetical protein
MSVTDAPRVAPTLTIDLARELPLKAVVIVFDPSARPEEHTVYGDAGASQLVPVLRSVLARLESGALRMPVGDGAAWVSCEPE